MGSIYEFMTSNSTSVIAAIAAAVILGLIALLHLYWSWGGRWGTRAVVPTIDGQPMFSISPVGSFTIFFTFILGALLLLGRVGMYGKDLPTPFIYEWTPWIFTALFVLRALGDFKHIGLFKKVRFTYFAWWDTWFIVPLCLVLALLCVVVGLSESPFKVVGF